MGKGMWKNRITLAAIWSFGAIVGSAVGDGHAPTRDFEFVVFANPDAGPTLDGKRIPTHGRIRAYTVIEDRGEWLSVIGGLDRVTGLARRSDVIPVQGAVEYISKTIRAAKQPAKAYWYRGRLRLLLSDFNGALADFDESIRRDARFAPAYVGRGEAKVFARSYEEAIGDFSRAIQLDAKCASAFECRGNLWPLVGQPQRAVADLTEAIRLDPDDGIARYWRGVAYYTLRQFDEAMADYNRSLQLCPGLSLAYSARGGLWKEKGDLPRAKDDLDRAIALDPSAVDAYCMRGDVMYSQGELDRAIKDFDAVVQIAPNLPVGYCLRAQALARKADFQRALNDANRALQIDRGFAMAYCVRGAIHARLGKPDLALTEFGAALHASPGFALAHLGSAFAYHDKGMYEQALAEMENASRADQELSSNLRLYRAWILATCPDRGIRNGRKALELATDCYQKIGALANPADAVRSAACVVLAAANAEAGDFASAVLWQKRSLKAAPRPSARPGAGTEISSAWIESVLTLYRANTTYRESESDVRRGFVQHLRALVPLSSFTVESVVTKPSNERG